ncbi:DNA internalization-related competence protein ComEC/Rec2 [Gelria sp. Kuro-4]|uniref:DNA internalization-related competence protein ComEC/Rec2 n=1 Tax=Gelria sp. Kuro-4 TaxID=2796927 RepID=UPI001BF0EB78|nr:DNA internalization-related competence protein ComEC/Rec2 [Gelria sp. Kuro-4]BCV24547.1 DNA internalization-related competence protein ComEC/Rec2 [Gelria sp. Kuro-4]
MPPLVTLTLLFIAGTVARVKLPFPSAVWLGAAALALVLGLFFLTRERRCSALIALLLLAFFSGGVRTSLALLPERSLAPLAGSHVTLEGVVVRPAEQGQAGTNYVLAVRLAGAGEALAPARGLVLVRDLRPPGRPVYAYGDVLRVKGVLARPRPAGNFGQFDYRAYLEQRGIAYTLPLYEPQAITRVAAGAGNPLAAGLYAWRERFTQVASLLGPREKALLLGIALGERRGLAPEVTDLFTASGTVHLLAVSGTHVALVAGLALGAARLLRLPPVLQGLLSALVVGLYAFWTGLPASALRAGLMFLLGFLGLLSGRPRNGLLALTAAALIILLVNPLLLFDIGFQLSFAAAGGIIWLTPPLLAARRQVPVWAAAPLAVSLAAQLAVWPLTAYYFSGVSLVGFLAGLVAVPLAGLALGLGLAGLLGGAVYLPAGKVVLGAAGLALALLTTVAQTFARLPLAYVYLKQPPLPFLTLYYLLLFALPWVLQHRQSWPRWRQVGALGVACLLLFLAWRGAGPGPAPLSVDFLDVGQGDAILIRSPSGEAALIDAGPRQAYEGRVWDAGESVVLPYLRAQGVHRLEVLFLTHGDADHAGGAPAILAGLPVGAVIAPPGFAQAGPPPVLSRLNDQGVPLYAGTRGLKVNLGAGVELTVYGPPGVPLASESPDNDNSLVLYLRYGNTGFLFMGDAGAAAEEALMEEGLPAPVDVLKVAHHGADTGTGEAFLHKVHPELAVISVGKNNFGHPSPATLARLTAAGTTVLRTDQVGQVRVLADGKRLRVFTRREGGEDKP